MTMNSSLPVISAPQFTVLLQDGSEVRMRSFLMKEYKLLMVAKESGNDHEVAVTQLINNCVVTEGIDANTLPFYDVEQLFVNLYINSIGGDEIDVKYRCQHEVGEGEEKKKCGSVIPHKIALRTAQFEGEARTGKDAVIEVSNGVWFEMRYPTVFEYDAVLKDDVTATFDVLCKCVSKVITEDRELIADVDYNSDGIGQMIDGMSPDVIKELMEFITSAPQLKLTTVLQCPKCKHPEPIQLTGLRDFFM